MDSETFWNFVTHQANRPLDKELQCQMAAAALDYHGNVAERNAMLAACDYYGWDNDSGPNYRRAMFQAETAAVNGFPWGDFYLGVGYHLGNGVAKNDVLAFSHLEKAANAGLLLALLDLGHCYREGFGVLPDQAEAFRLFKQAAEGGLALGAFMEAYCHESGLGVEFNLEAAKELYGKAADAGLIMAAKRLGDIRQQERERGG